jgi:hypothetical protein
MMTAMTTSQRKSRHLRLSIALLMAGLLLAPGCSETRDSLRDAIQTVDQRISAGILGFERRTRVRGGGAQVSDGIFMAAAAERVSQAALLPPEVQGEDAVSLVSRDPLRLEEIADRLTDITGIPHITALGPAGLRSSSNLGARDQAANEADTTVPQQGAEEGSHHPFGWRWRIYRRTDDDPAQPQWAALQGSQRGRGRIRGRLVL